MNDNYIKEPHCIHCSSSFIFPITREFSLVTYNCLGCNKDCKHYKLPNIYYKSPTFIFISKLDITRLSKYVIEWLNQNFDHSDDEIHKLFPSVPPEIELLIKLQ